MSEIFVTVDGHGEMGRILPFNEALVFAWYLLGLCATMLDTDHSLFSSILNTLDNRGIDPVQCHADFEQEYGFLVTAEAWEKLNHTFENKDEWKVAFLAISCC